MRESLSREPARCNIVACHVQGSRAFAAKSVSLYGADLSGADLRDAHLSNVWLYRVHLRGADLRGAYLSDADLRGADLRGATVTEEQLASAKSLEGATIPTARSTTNARRSCWRLARAGKIGEEPVCTFLPGGKKGGRAAMQAGIQPSQRERREDPLLEEIFYRSTKRS
jgi:hypothetical protein